MAVTSGVRYDVFSPLHAPGWDTEITEYSSKSLFHESAWLRFLALSQGATPTALRLLDQTGSVIGYFCGAEVRKACFRLLGSPLQGWTTYGMGPIVDGEFSAPLLASFEDYCRRRRVDYAEIASPTLPADVMRAAGYEEDLDPGYFVDIDDEASMWQRLEPKSCRYAIRRAARDGLRVEATTDRAFIDVYYAQLEDVFLRQGLVPTYQRKRVEHLWDCLMPADRLLALQVRHAGEPIATGLFPFDERAIYFWGGASWVRSYALHPNELLHWHVMLFALERGISVYRMGGGGTFKRKFGGRLVNVPRWFKVFSPGARLGRAAYRRYIAARQRVLGRWRRGFTSPRPPLAVRGLATRTRHSEAGTGEA